MTFFKSLLIAIVSLYFWLALSSLFYKILICFCKLDSFYAPEFIPVQFFFFYTIFFWKLAMCISMLLWIYFSYWMAAEI